MTIPIQPKARPDLLMYPQFMRVFSSGILHPPLALPFSRILLRNGEIHRFACFSWDAHHTMHGSQEDIFSRLHSTRRMLHHDSLS